MAAGRADSHNGSSRSYGFVMAFVRAAVLLLLPLLAVSAPVAADNNNGDDDVEAAPEPYLPRPPTPLALVPLVPVIKAPDARDLLKACTEPSFIDCFREWQPPPPPPEVAKVTPPPPPPPKAGEPREPAEPGGASGGKPPPPQPEADRATYEALLKAIREVGLESKVRLPNPPKEGSTTMTLDSQKKAPAKP